MSHPSIVGILGGTFDPIHYGHLNIANYCLAELDMNRIIFIPMPYSDPPSYSPSRQPTTTGYVTIGY